METAPLISIITITFNAEKCILPTLESVYRQTYRNYEHIIIDGASTDGTLTEARKYPDLRILSERDKGLYDAMNKGLDMARGRYLLFLNAGDTFHSDKTLAAYAERARKGDDIIFGDTVIVDSARHIIGPRHLTAPQSLTFESFAQGMLVCHQAFMVRKELAPHYDLQYRFSADYDWCVQCLQHSRRNVYTGAVLIDYLSEGLTTSNRRASLMERFRIMCRYYGTLPTVWRHVGFFFRNLKRKFNVPV